MCRTGVLGYGGGPSVIPLIRYEAVTRYKWMNDEEFGEVLALANALPGPIATKMAAYLGFRLKGSWGALIAVLAHIIPTCFAMVALMSAVQFLSTSPIIKGMIAAVTPVVTVMIGLMAYEFAEKSIKGLGKIVGIALFILCFVLLQVIHLHPAILIVIALLYGSFHFRVVRLFQQPRKESGQ